MIVLRRKCKFYSSKWLYKSFCPRLSRCGLIPRSTMPYQTFDICLDNANLIVEVRKAYRRLKQHQFDGWKGFDMS